MRDPPRRKNEFAQIFKQTLSNNNMPNGPKKVWVPPAAQQAIKKISDHKKAYVSPYSQKAIQQQKPVG
jgi:hypothetical protein